MRVVFLRRAGSKLFHVSIFSWSGAQCRAFLLLGAWALIAVTAFAQPQVHPAQPGIWPGFTRGDALAVRISGQFAYVGLSHGGLSGGLAVVDISDPTAPNPVGGIDLGGVVCGLDVANGYAYVAAHSAGVQIFNVSVATNPVCAASFATGGFAWDIQIVGHYAYVAVTDVGLVVLDVSDPAHPAQAGVLPMTGWVKKLHVVSNVVYMAFGDRLEIVGVSNATNLTQVGTYRSSANINDAQVSGRYAYLAGGRLEIVDISNPAAPTLVGTGDLVDWAGTALKVAGHYVYVTVDPMTMLVFDVADPANPVNIGEGYTGEFPHDLEVVGQYAYVAAELTGLHVFDISDPAHPSRVGRYGVSGSADGIQVGGKYAYLTDGYAGLEILDVSNPAKPVWAGGYFTGGQLTGLQLAGQTAYVSDRDGGLYILDVSRPATPQLAGKTTNIGTVNGFQVVGSYAYLACNSGLTLVDISNQSHPVPVGSCRPPDYFGGLIAVRVAGHVAYVAIDRDMYTDTGAIDVTDPAHPVYLRALNNSGGSWITDIQEVGQYLLVADSTPLLKVYERSDPTNLVLAATFRIPGWADTIVVVGNYAYVSEGNAGVQVLDVSNPTNLVAVGMFDSHGPAANIFVEKKLVYLAEWGKGLVILPSAPLIQFTLQVDGLPNLPFTVECATDFTSTQSWATLFTTNSPSMPFWFTDTNVVSGPKFYRVHQP